MCEVGSIRPACVFGEAVSDVAGDSFVMICAINCTRAWTGLGLRTRAWAFLGRDNGGLSRVRTRPATDPAFPSMGSAENRQFLRRKIHQVIQMIQERFSGLPE